MNFTSIAIATIRANDEPDGEILTISAIPYEYEGVHGYQLIASNGDDIGYYKPKSLDQCRADADAYWGSWASWELA